MLIIANFLQQDIMTGLKVLLTLFKQYSRLIIRKYSFVSRVAKPWNNLSNKIVNANSVSEFKKL